MEPVTLIFEVDGIRSEFEKVYKDEPTREQLFNDIKEWFFNEHYMWFSVKKNGKEINLGDLFKSYYT